jgi:hypothetical protein
VGDGITSSVDYTKGNWFTVRHFPRVPKPRSVRKLVNFGCVANFSVHCDNLVNLTHGIVERVLFVSKNGVLSSTPCPKPNIFKKLKTESQLLIDNVLSTTVVPKELYSSLYSGRKKITYEKAYTSLCSRRVIRSDAVVKSFVKAEKINLTAKPNPVPRIIQPRDPRYNLCVGRYLKLLEGKICKAYKRVYGDYVVTKGLNADQLGEVIYRKWSRYTDPVCYGLDASRFDQHVSVDALKFEHEIYNSIFKSSELKHLLEWQLDNQGIARARDGIVKYRKKGCRMSGDINTSLGNSIIMSSIVLSYLRVHGIKADVVNNGDDCLIILERREHMKVQQFPQYALDFGFNIIMEPMVDQIEKIEFCQCHPVFCENSYKMVRNFPLSISKDLVSLLSWDSERQFNTWRDAIGVCGLELCRGVPVLESFYSSLVVESNRGGLETVYDTGMGFMAKGCRHRVINDETRLSFYRAFGVLPDIQIELESMYKNSNISFSKPQLINSYRVNTIDRLLKCLN